MKTRRNLYMMFAVLSLSLACPIPARADQVQVDYIYNLSDFMGTAPYSWARIFLDNESGDIFAVDAATSVQIFNKSGMGVYSFGEAGDYGQIYDGAVDKDGDILLLSYDNSGGGRSFSILHCDYRGEIVSKVALSGVPAEFAGFTPGRLIYHDGLLYLADLNRMLVVVAEADGVYKSGYNLQSLLKLNQNEVTNTGIVGFSVDGQGDLLFTIPVLSTAYRVTPDLVVTSFGKAGSARGKFGVVGGIAKDNKGFYYVADTLRCVVIVFDKDFKFLTEFGGRGYGPGELIAPMDLAVDKSGKVFVAQGGKRGVSVFGVSYTDPPKADL